MVANIYLNNYWTLPFPLPSFRPLLWEAVVLELEGWHSKLTLRQLSGVCSRTQPPMHLLHSSRQSQLSGGQIVVVCSNVNTLHISRKMGLLSVPEKCWSEGGSGTVGQIAQNTVSPGNYRIAGNPNVSLFPSYCWYCLWLFYYYELLVYSLSMICINRMS